MAQSPIKVGVIAEQTGPLSFMGIADANVAKMVVDDINTRGASWGGSSRSAARTARLQTAWQ